VLDGDRPARVPDKVIAELKGRERNGLVELPLPRGFRCGDPVCVTRGVFAGQLAVFDGMRPSNAHNLVCETLADALESEKSKTPLA
jgi:hypothetical protein